jgi:hypothetical protein
MDYFTELLESYNKLKKRTFKLRYLTEGSSPEALASQYIGGATEAETPITADSTGQPVNMSIHKNKEGAVIVKGIGGFASGRMVQEPGLEFGGSGQVIPEVFQEFVAALTGEGGGDPAAAGTLGQVVVTERNPGEHLRAQGIDPTIDTLVSFERQQKILDDYCAIVRENQIKGRGGSPEELRKKKNECASLKQNLFIHTKNSFESKLANGIFYTFTEDGEAIESKISPRVAEELVISHEHLLTFLIPDNDIENNCATVSSRIGKKGKDNLVLYTSDEKSEGMVVRANAVQKRALEAFENICSNGLQDVKFGKYSSKEKNAVKGTFYEDVIATVINLRSCNNNPDREQAALCKKQYSTEFAAHVREKRNILKSIFSSMNRDVAYDLDTGWELDIMKETLGNIEGGSFDAWVLQEIEPIMDFINLVDADNAIPFGGTAKTGAREDILLAYNDKAKAEIVAEALGGMEVKLDPKTNQYILGVGLKRLMKIKKAKFGEINSLTRLIKMARDDKELVGDNKIEPTFIKRTIARVFGSKNAAFNNAVSTIEKVESDIREQRALISDNATYKDKKSKKLATLTPQSAIAILGDSVNKLKFSDKKTTLLGKALYMVLPNKEPQLRKFEDSKENRERLAETYSRLARINAYKELVTKGSPKEREAGIDAILYQATICGSNASDQTQLIVDDSGEVLAVNHNKIFDELMKDKGNNTYEFGESSITITSPDGISITLSMEGRPGQDDSRGTRFSCMVPKETLSHPSIAATINTKTLTKEDVLTSFLKGQLHLLETLLSQTK